jgi:dihydroorotase
MTYNLLIKGGRVLDPGQEIDEVLDIAVMGETISVIDKDLSNDAEKIIDATGKIVTPGLIDLHTHIYWGISRHRLDPDSLAPNSGVTTMADAGSVNYDSWPGFKRFIIDKSQTRVFSFINARGRRERTHPIEQSGLTSDIYNTVLLIKENRKDIIGVKTFAGYNNERFGERTLELASEIAYHADVPIMLHISFAPPRIEEVLPLLRKGDVLTHCYTPNTQRIVDRDGKLLAEAKEAIERGVLLDIGHGAGSFHFNVAMDLLKQGVKPYTISTDLHGGCVNGPTYDLVTTLSKFLNLGLPLEDVILRATTNPAKIIEGPKELGILKEGGVADMAVLEVKKGDFEFMDTHRWVLKGKQKIVVTNTITRGRIMEELVTERYTPYQGMRSTVSTYNIKR